MPYISQTSRNEIDSILVEFAKHAKDMSVGELNYLISSMASEFILKNSLSYGNINAVVGVLNCVAYEFYRRVAQPYEDKKKAENGDVYNT